MAGVGFLRFETVVRPQKAEAVCLKLFELGVVLDLQAQEVLGSGRRADGPTDDPVIDTLPKALIAGYVESDDIEAVVDTIQTHARSGRIGDGKVWIYPITATTA
ncbi:MAG: P-II family nitrogen regulator [Planctomycetota bacterium]|jgi:nitrogen regulatory protein P-II 1|nr:P-II family nitrogen regulator [Planctomycetota bacterium]